MFRSFRHSLIGKIVFTHDVRVAILVITQNGGGHIDVRVIPGGIEVFSYVNSFFFLIYKTAHHVIENVMFETCRSVGIKSAIDCHSPIRQNKFRQPCELDSLVRRLASFMIQQKKITEDTGLFTKHTCALT